MDKVISARIDAEVAALLDSITRRYKRTKKEFLESAIRREAEAQESEIERRLAIVRQTAGILSDQRADEILRDIAAAREQEDARIRKLWGSDRAP